MKWLSITPVVALLFFVSCGLQNKPKKKKSLPQAQTEEQANQEEQDTELDKSSGETEQTNEENEEQNGDQSEEDSGDNEPQESAETPKDVAGLKFKQTEFGEPEFSISWDKSDDATEYLVAIGSSKAEERCDVEGVQRTNENSILISDQPLNQMLYIRVCAAHKNASPAAAVGVAKVFVLHTARPAPISNIRRSGGNSISWEGDLPENGYYQIAYNYREPKDCNSGMPPIKTKEQSISLPYRDKHEWHTLKICVVNGDIVPLFSAGVSYQYKIKQPGSGPSPIPGPHSREVVPRPNMNLPYGGIR